jgi:hypothetical protein
MRVEIFWRYEGEVAAAARSLGTFAPGQTVTVPLVGSAGHNLILSTVSLSPENLRSVRELADAHEVLVVF